MGSIQLLSAIAFPLLMAVGGIYAWRMSKKENDPVATNKSAWRDDSLDDWRKERDEQLAAERDGRQSTAETRQSEGAGNEAETTNTRHQRIGG